MVESSQLADRLTRDRSVDILEAPEQPLAKKRFLARRRETS
jgi:hypothetical protein